MAQFFEVTDTAGNPHVLEASAIRLTQYNTNKARVIVMTESLIIDTTALYADLKTKLLSLP